MPGEDHRPVLTGDATQPPGVAVNLTVDQLAGGDGQRRRAVQHDVRQPRRQRHGALRVDRVPDVRALAVDVRRLRCNRDRRRPQRLVHRSGRLRQRHRRLDLPRRPLQPRVPHNGAVVQLHHRRPARVDHRVALLPQQPRLDRAQPDRPPLAGDLVADVERPRVAHVRPRVQQVPPHRRAHVVGAPRRVVAVPLERERQSRVPHQLLGARVVEVARLVIVHAGRERHALPRRQLVTLRDGVLPHKIRRQHRPVRGHRLRRRHAGMIAEAGRCPEMRAAPGFGGTPYRPSRRARGDRG